MSNMVSLRFVLRFVRRQNRCRWQLIRAFNVIHNGTIGCQQVLAFYIASLEDNSPKSFATWLK